jgi:hypothetical protein
VNGTVLTENQIVEFLQQVKAQFGEPDPVYIRSAGDVSLEQFFDPMKIVERTHHDIHLIVTIGTIQKEIRFIDSDVQ